MNVRNPLPAEAVAVIAAEIAPEIAIDAPLVPEAFCQAIIIAIPAGLAMWGILLLAASRLIAVLS